MLAGGVFIASLLLGSHGLATYRLSPRLACLPWPSGISCLLCLCAGVSAEHFSCDRLGENAVCPIGSGHFCAVPAFVPTWSSDGGVRLRSFCLLPRLSDATLHVCGPMAGTRVGEAANPGPSSFRISVIDPTAINNKFDLLATLPPGIYAVSESHLTSVGLQRFRAALRRTSHFKFIPGAPVELRARSIVSGMYSGVGFLSSFPTRTVPNDWDQHLYASGRIAACSFFIEPLWVLGVTLYGYATGKERTADLVRAAFDRVLALPAGPRFVAGDFNLLLSEVPHLEALRQHGFRELQEVAQIKF